ncbi:class II fructose-bisphosphate aldolase [Tsukamurella tyrosinosolvens]|uniref:class II fructose-bisphosphate aldolase n=1 Tax=Tsukamurella tyrosinosolvens TaxID=57704 RepID=UPI000DF6FD1F|nr:class II fructose-bisphosphate aldolase [Tsukamurella tyrosinosolvens]RDB47294.1 class II fructose-bisphosphate aldolase [Tsukamurella tyrosinosolvens]
MTLMNLREAIALASDEGRALGAFNVVHVETAEALVAAAETADLPVVLQISQNCADYHRGLAPLALACYNMADHSRQSVVLHLDHAEDPALILAALDLGFTSVMYDGSRLPFADNVGGSRAAVLAAEQYGASVEAELGEVGGKEGAHVAGARTEPAQAKEFCDLTGVDALAVAVGSSHAMATRTAALDIDLVEQLRRTVPVPLVLHGSSGVPDSGIRGAIDAGIAKVNVSTHLNAVFTRELADYMARQPDVIDSRKYVAAGRDALQTEATRLLRLFAGHP